MSSSFYVGAEELNLGPPVCVGHCTDWALLSPILCFSSVFGFESLISPGEGVKYALSTHSIALLSWTTEANILKSAEDEAEILAPAGWQTSRLLVKGHIVTSQNKFMPAFGKTWIWSGLDLFPGIWHVLQFWGYINPTVIYVQCDFLKHSVKEIAGSDRK